MVMQEDSESIVYQKDDHEPTFRPPYQFKPDYLEVSIKNKTL